MNPYKLATLAKIAYIQDSREMLKALSSFLPHSHDKYTIYVKRTDTEGYVCRQDKHLYIAFSGTESFRDLFNDIRFFPDTYIAGFIHRGFKAILDDVGPKILEVVAAILKEHSIDSVDVVGHSLGGVIAIGCAEIIHPFFEDIQVTTFGCPNGWSRQAVRYMNTRHKKIINYINWFDIVTLLLAFITSRPGTPIHTRSFPGHKLDNYINWLKRKEVNR